MADSNGIRAMINTLFPAPQIKVANAPANDVPTKLDIVEAKNIATALEKVASSIEKGDVAPWSLGAAAQAAIDGANATLVKKAEDKETDTDMEGKPVMQKLAKRAKEVGIQI